MNNFLVSCADGISCLNVLMGTSILELLSDMNNFLVSCADGTRLFSVVES